jgi:hypothetical protein
MRAICPAGPPKLRRPMRHQRARASLNVIVGVTDILVEI